MKRRPRLLYISLLVLYLLVFANVNGDDGDEDKEKDEDEDEKISKAVTAIETCNQRQTVSLAAGRLRAVQEAWDMYLESDEIDEEDIRVICTGGMTFASVTLPIIKELSAENCPHSDEASTCSEAGGEGERLTYVDDKNETWLYLPPATTSGDVIFIFDCKQKAKPDVDDEDEDEEDEDEEDEDEEDEDEDNYEEVYDEETYGDDLDPGDDYYYEGGDDDRGGRKRKRYRRNQRQARQKVSSPVGAILPLCVRYAWYQNVLRHESMYNRPLISFVSDFGTPNRPYIEYDDCRQALQPCMKVSPAMSDIVNVFDDFIDPVEDLNPLPECIQENLPDSLKLEPSAEQAIDDEFQCEPYSPVYVKGGVNDYDFIDRVEGSFGYTFMGGFMFMEVSNDHRVVVCINSIPPNDFLPDCITDELDIVNDDLEQCVALRYAVVNAGITMKEKIQFVIGMSENKSLAEIYNTDISTRIKIEKATISANQVVEVLYFDDTYWLSYNGTEITCDLSDRIFLTASLTDEKNITSISHLTPLKVEFIIAQTTFPVTIIEKRETRNDLYALVLVPMFILIAAMLIKMRRLQKKQITIVKFKRPPPDEWEYNPEHLILGSEIGSGAFGVVHSGVASNIRRKRGHIPVAVKECGDDATPDDKVEFIGEASLMKRFDHQNVIRLLGVCMQEEPLRIIVELMPLGSLKDVLRSANTATLDVGLLIKFTMDATAGVSYLATLNFVHRDIAARNCLVNNALTVKIADFGMSREVVFQEYYRLNNHKLLPVRWMAMEALTDGNFTVKTDIWSLGVLIWEIFSMCEVPYAAMSNMEVYEFIRQNGRLSRPPNCPEFMFLICESCWASKPTDRPSAEEIIKDVENHFDWNCMTNSKMLEALLGSSFFTSAGSRGDCNSASSGPGDDAQNYSGSVTIYEETTSYQEPIDSPIDPDDNFKPYSQTYALRNSSQTIQDPNQSDHDSVSITPYSEPISLNDSHQNSSSGNRDAQESASPADSNSNHDGVDEVQPGPADTKKQEMSSSSSTSQPPKSTGQHRSRKKAPPRMFGESLIEFQNGVLKISDNGAYGTGQAEDEAEYPPERQESINSGVLIIDNVYCETNLQVEGKPIFVPVTMHEQTELQHFGLLSDEYGYGSFVPLRQKVDKSHFFSRAGRTESTMKVALRGSKGIESVYAVTHTDITTGRRSESPTLSEGANYRFFMAKNKKHAKSKRRKRAEYTASTKYQTPVMVLDGGSSIQEASSTDNYAAYSEPRLALNHNGDPLQPIQETATSRPSRQVSADSTTGFQSVFAGARASVVSVSNTKQPAAPRDSSAGFQSVFRSSIMDDRQQPRDSSVGFNSIFDNNHPPSGKQVVRTYSEDVGRSSTIAFPDGRVSVPDQYSAASFPLNVDEPDESLDRKSVPATQMTSFMGSGRVSLQDGGVNGEHIPREHIPQRSSSSTSRSSKRLMYTHAV